MLSAATLGMFVYGVHAIASVVVGSAQGTQLEVWAQVATVGLGLLLVLSAAFVRVRLPGGLSLALGAMLGLQALAIHAGAHDQSGMAPQVLRAIVAGTLVALAHFARGDGPR